MSPLDDSTSFSHEAPNNTQRNDLKNEYNRVGIEKEKIKHKIVCVDEGIT